MRSEDRAATAATRAAVLAEKRAVETDLTDADLARAIRDLLQSQLMETDRIADASRVMLSIAQQNDMIARQFTEAVQSLVRSGQAFDTEVERFRFTRN